MPDIALNWDPSALIANMTLDGSDLKTGDELSSAVIISLFTWRRANPDDELPNDQSGKMGWWGDSYPSVENDKIGSRLWLYRRKKITATVIAELHEVVEEALEHLIDDGVAESVDVNLARQGMDMVSGTIKINSHSGEAFTLQFSEIWRSLNG